MSDETRNQPTGDINHQLELLHKDVYTPAEAAEVLNLEERFLLKAAFGGDLKATIIENDVVSVTRHSLVEWLKWREGH